MKCPNCDYDNVRNAASCAWCKKPLPREIPPPASPPTPVPAAQVVKKKPRASLRSVKPPEKKQLKYLALVGMLIAVISSEVLLQSNSSGVELVFGRGTFTGVRLLVDLIAAFIAYYNSYRLAAEPRPGAAFRRGAISGLLIGTIAGACVSPAAGAAFAGLLGLPLGALGGLLNLIVIHTFTKEEEEWAPPESSPAGEPRQEEAQPSYSQFYALIGGVFAVIANYLFLIPWQGEMRGRYDETLSATTLLCGGIGLFYGRKIAKTSSSGKAMHFGAAGGALIGVVNGTAVFPVIGTAIGGVLGALIGAFVGGPLAFYLIKFSRWALMGGGKAANPSKDGPRT